MNEIGGYDHYSMIVEWEPEGGTFVVTVPELSGCRTHGASYEEAVEHGQEAIESWIDAMRSWGRPIPSPRYFGAGPVHLSEQEAVGMK